MRDLATCIAAVPFCNMAHHFVLFQAFLVTSLLSVISFPILAHATYPPSTVLSSTGKHIPLHLITERFPGTVTDFIDDPAALLYEITSNHKLIGPNITFDILKHTERVSTTNSQEKLTVVYNSQRETSTRPDTYIRVGSGYTVAYRNHEDHVVAVWGNGLNLAPLDHLNYPGIFINVQLNPALAGSDFGTDMIAIPESARERKRAARDSESFGSAHQVTNDCARGVKHYVEIAVAYDNTFCALFANEEQYASAMIQSLFNAVNEVYTRDTCVELVLVHLETHCNDPNDPYKSISDFSVLEQPPCSDLEIKPYHCTPSGLTLRRFRDFWSDRRSSVRRDLAYFFSGFSTMEPVGGRAYLGVACNKKFGYGWVQTPVFEYFAHEVGHNLDATHTFSGIMRAPQRMNSRFFNSFTIAHITSYLDNDSSSECANRRSPICDTTCPGRCDGNQCIVSNDVPNGLVPCTPLRGFYNCAGSDLRAFPCGRANEFIRRPPSLKDTAVFCCLPPSATRTQSVVPATIPLAVRLDGQNRIIEDNIIWANSDILRLEVMTTTLVSDCKVPGSTPSSSPRPPAPQKRCADSFGRGRSFKCVNNKKIGSVIGTRFGVIARVFVKQRSGLTTAKVKVNTGLRIFSYGIGLRYSNRGNSIMRVPVASSNGTFTVLRSFDVLSYLTPIGEATCCKVGMWLYVSLSVCTRASGFSSCTVGFIRLLYSPKCKRICKKSTEQVVPFSATRACPICRK